MRRIPGQFLWTGVAALFLSPALLLAAEPQPLRYSTVPEIQQIRPKKPVNIRLHRNAKGEYSWDLTGDNVDDIIKTDTKLRKLLKTE
ncbi:MAG: hypothetical protein HGA78_06705 [Nitrospirales bacterium]|nr:hypothetical protein [Nitrospirales bacterium]